MTARCTCAGRASDPLDDAPGEEHEKGAPACVHATRIADRVAARIAWALFASTMLTLEAIAWLTQKARRP